MERGKDDAERILLDRRVDNSRPTRATDCVPIESGQLVNRIEIGKETRAEAGRFERGPVTTTSNSNEGRTVEDGENGRVW